MKAVIQRVSKASVQVEGEITGQIQTGFLVLLGVHQEDVREDLEWLAKKVANLRVFSDPSGLMNLGLKDVQGEVLVVSQFTLQASTKKGNRPSFLEAAKGEKAESMYEDFMLELQKTYGLKVESGSFGADMKVELLNDGPVTIIIDSRNRV
jgi:D-tyrosyl-tRNA(Tyr) deacylase